MQRLKAFPVAVINLFIRFFNYLLNKLKYLALHILKHPLGSIWWCIKMYFALMLLTLFVACSFGAMASTQLPCPNGTTPMDGVGCTVPAKQGSMYKAVRAPDSGSGPTPSDALTSFIQSYTSKTTPCKTNGSETRSIVGTPSLGGGPVNFSASMTVKYTCTWTQYNSATQKYDTLTSNTQLSLTGISITPNKGFTCPPEGPAWSEYLQLIITGADSAVCAKPFEFDNTCFKEPDFQLSNQYHFDPTSAGAGNVCVENDSGKKCSWIELPGNGGVFQPDLSPSNPCESTPPPPDSNPADKPQDPEKCTAGGNGMKVCKADPNEKCVVNSTGAMSCPDSCGFMNGEFMCFTEPDIPDDPNEPPKKPVPEPDDNITDPLKKMPDMNKQDLKEIQRGVESRLDSFSVSMDNALGELAAQGKNAEKAAGIGNKLLNSINQNTADTVKELKKLTGDESNPQPNYEETELGEKNDWQVRNFGTVMKAAADKILEKPMFQAIDGYFDVSFGGTCPTWNVSVWVFEVEINQFCDQSFQAILPLIRNVVILIFSILAFRVAFL